MSRKKPSSFAPYFTGDDADQVRAAFLAVGHAEGYASISELIEAATLKEVRRLQRKHHNSKPWEGAGLGALRPGQRTRDEQNKNEKTPPQPGNMKPEGTKNPAGPDVSARASPGPVNQERRSAPGRVFPG